MDLNILKPAQGDTPHVQSTSALTSIVSISKNCRMVENASTFKFQLGRLAVGHRKKTIVLSQNSPILAEKLSLVKIRPDILGFASNSHMTLKTRMQRSSWCKKWKFNILNNSCGHKSSRMYCTDLITCNSIARFGSRVKPKYQRFLFNSKSFRALVFPKSPTPAKIA